MPQLDRNSQRITNTAGANRILIGAAVVLIVIAFSLIAMAMLFYRGGDATG